MKKLYVSSDKNSLTDEIKTNYFVLIKNTGWNDYSYKTAFSLYIDVNDIFTLIGEVKILKKGQLDNGLFHLENGEIDSLGTDFCSLGQSLDYYERISELSDEDKDILLKKLNDIIYTFNEDQYFENNDFSEDDGYKNSLFRYISKDDDIILMSKAVLEKKYDSLALDELNFSFKPNNWDEPIKFNFTGHVFSLFEAKSLLPGNIACIVGSNGTGKSTFLSRLARVAYATKKDRVESDFGGSLEPNGLGFPRIITISYSAFDNFTVPGINLEEKQQIIKDMEHEKGRYFYCGLRDIINEELEELDEDKVVENKLKSMQMLSNEFKNKLTLIQSKERILLLQSSLELFKNEPSFEKILSNFRSTKLTENEVEKIVSLFLEWSTGHKIIMHIIVNLIAHIENKTLILLDEPENHLHPPLLSIFMHVVRYILKEKKSFCIIATHSPVVLQETLSKDVSILTQYDNTVKPSKPEIQTFAESIGLITSEVFELNSSITDYHSILKNLSDNYEYEEILDAFNKQMSTQGRAYLISNFAKKK